MKRKRSYLIIISALFLVAAGHVYASEDIQKHPDCPFCGMDRQKFAFSRMLITYDDGSVAGVCSLHCTAIDFAINIETITSVENIDDIIALDKLDLLSSITFGRSDFVQSMGLSKSEVNSDIVYQHVKRVATLAKEKNLKFAMGGNVTKNSIEFIKALYSENLLHKYETRKVVFEASFIEQNPEEGLELALKFELLWLKSKKRFYSKIKEEDEQRILDLEKRIKI